jgi:hypothetical protein
MTERLISEAIEPLYGDGAEDRGFVAGEPIPPSRFRWGEREVAVAAILETWKGLSPQPASGHGGRYVRRHWYRVRTAEGEVMTIYLVRTTPKRGQQGWWLYSVGEAPSA